MAIADGKNRRHITLPTQVWEQIDHAAGVEQSTASDVLLAAMQHECPVGIDLAQLRLDVETMRTDLQALVALVEQWRPVVEAPMEVTPKAALADWYASNTMPAPVAEAVDILASVRYADTPPAGRWARLWRWLVFTPKRSL